MSANFLNTNLFSHTIAKMNFNCKQPRMLLDSWQSRGPEVSEGDFQNNGSRVSTSAHIRISEGPKNGSSGGLGQKSEFTLNYSEFTSDSEIEMGKCGQLLKKAGGDIRREFRMVKISVHRMRESCNSKAEVDNLGKKWDDMWKPPRLWKIYSQGPKHMPAPWGHHPSNCAAFSTGCHSASKLGCSFRTWLQEGMSSGLGEELQT